MPIIQTPDNERKETGLATSILAGCRIWCI
jgi:hypothetical protein